MVFLSGVLMILGEKAPETDSFTGDFRPIYTVMDILMKKVIMTEDVRTLLAREHSFLDRAAVRALPAGTNEDIFSLHSAEKADLIIARLASEGMTGDVLCSLIRQDEGLRNVSIILICPEKGTDLEECASCGANAFITSPVNTAVLLQEAYQLLQVPPRRSCRMPLRIRLEGTAENRPFTGLVENISSSGMLFRSSAMFDEGDALYCSFSLGGPVRQTAGAEIVRVVEGGRGRRRNFFGVRFASLTGSVQSAIEAFVRGKTCKD